MSTSSAIHYQPAILLTGGAGFLGKAIIRELLNAESPVQPSLLRIFDLRENPGFHDPRIQWVKGDIRNASLVHLACEGIDLVIHSASVVDWGTKPESEVISVNFGGTENVVRACLEQRVKHLVYTSSLDAIFNGKPMVDIDESIPYPDHHPNAYCRSKCLSEKLVQNCGMLNTCILRPSDIYGEGDPYHIGSLINMAKGGFYVRLGNGASRSQHVYVGNMAWAHVLAAYALLSGNPKVLGSVYFITDGPASNFFKFFDRIVEGAGYRLWPKNIWIPRKTAYFMGALSEGFAWLFRPIKKYTPKFSRFAVDYTCSDFTFKTRKAEQDFGFTPRYNEAEAFSRTVNGFRRKETL